MAKLMSRQASWLGLPLLALGLGAIAQPAVAQSYPSDMIRIVLSGPAGTPPWRKALQRAGVILIEPDREGGPGVRLREPKG